MAQGPLCGIRKAEHLLPLTEGAKEKGRWIQISLAAGLMAATLPARTHGLGLITEPLLAEGGLTREGYATWNAVATLLGALGCPLAGWIFDRAGLRIPTGATLLLLAAAVFAMGASPVQGGALGFGIALLATRPLGQGALSVASITLMGRWGRNRTGPEMAGYGILMTVFFAAAFGGVAAVIRESGWRSAWQGIAIGLVILGLIALAALREPTARAAAPIESTGFAGNVLGVPLFWLYALATSLFGLASSGFGLFTEGILAESGHGRETYHLSMIVALIAGFGGQAVCGALGSRMAPHRLLGLAIAGYGLAIGAYVGCGASPQAPWLLAAANGFTGGIFTVLFFSVWAQTFGQRQLGRIQGMAQACTVVASAFGPLVFSRFHAVTGSYDAALVVCCIVLTGCGLLCLAGSKLFLQSFQTSIAVAHE